MRNFQKHLVRVSRLGTFFAGAFIVSGLAMLPLAAHADVLQSTFGNGYDFVDAQQTSLSIQTSTSIKTQGQGTFEPTFGEGYAFLEKDSLTPIVITKEPVSSAGTEIFAGAPPKKHTTSAFQSLFGEGYGSVIKTD